MSVLAEAFGVHGLPSDWQELPLYAVAQERKGNKNTGMAENNLLSLSFGNIVRKDIEGSGGLLPESFDGYQIVESGDLVMRLTDLQNDKRSLRSGLATERGIITSAYLALVPVGLDPRYFAHVMRAYDVAKVLYPLGGGLRQSIGYEDIRRLPIVVPPIDEQRRIADFLDDQVGRIDQAIELRKEQTVLAREFAETRLITEMLSATSSTVRVKNLLQDERLGAWGEEPDGIDDVHVVRVADFNRVNLTATEAPTLRKLSSSQANSRLLRKGDVLLERSGGGAENPVGFAVLFEPSNNDPHITSNFVSRLRPKCEVSGPYLRYVLAAMYHARWNAAHYTQTTGIQNLRSESYLGVSVPLHDKQTQLALVKKMDFVFSATSVSVKVLEDSIVTLEERKRSLITAAVTGELDVSAARSLTGPWVSNTLKTNVEQTVMATGVAL